MTTPVRQRWRLKERKKLHARRILDTAKAQGRNTVTREEERSFNAILDRLRRMAGGWRGRLGRLGSVVDLLQFVGGLL